MLQKYVFSTKYIGTQPGTKRSHLGWKMQATPNLNYGPS